MGEVTNEQKLYILLGYKKGKTDRDRAIISTLENKAELGKRNLEEADKECSRQGWLNTIHVVEDLGYTIKSSSRVELSEFGLTQIDKFWRESKYNPRNKLKESMKVWAPVASIAVAIILNYEAVWRLICRIILSLFPKGNL